MKNNGRGFSTVELLLTIIAVSIVGFVGYYVWHSQNQASKTVSVSSTTTTETTNVNVQTIAIKEWGVKAPYSGDQTLTYEISKDGRTAGFTSTQLLAMDPSCTSGYGGSIQRLAPNEDATVDGSGGFTAEQRAKDTAKDSYAFVGGYYYFFVHSQSMCPSASTPSGQEADLVTTVNQAVKSLVPKLHAE